MSLSACDCAGTATIPDGSACFTSTDCGAGFTCRDGVCIAGLPIGEGEGEGEAPGEEGEGEGEGEDEPVNLIVAPTTLALPQTDVGVAITGTAQLVNVGGGDVTLGSLTSSDPRFAVVSPAAGLVIARNASVALTIRFTPTAAGDAAATVTVAVAVPSGSSAPVLTVSGSAPTPTVEGGFAVRAGPDDSSLGLPGCQCRPAIPPALVRVAYQAVGGGTCERPRSNLACAANDSCQPCQLGLTGAARWRAPRYEVDARTGEDWIVDEEIVHNGNGDDGDFIARVTLVDDCQALLAGNDNNTDFGCCFAVDCTSGDFDCYPYQEPISCSTDCNFFVSTSRNDGECMQRGPITVRARLTLDDGEREFCGTMTRDQTVDFARVQRRGGAFTVTQVAASFTELAAVGAPCP